MSETITYVVPTTNPDANIFQGYTPATSILAGMPVASLQSALSVAQQAYLDISTGAKAVTIQYSQGDGGRSVTYQMSNLANLVALIKQLQMQLGIVRSARRAPRFIYR